MVLMFCCRIVIKDYIYYNKYINKTTLATAVTAITITRLLNKAAIHTFKILLIYLFLCFVSLGAYNYMYNRGP